MADAAHASGPTVSQMSVKACAVETAISTSRMASAAPRRALTSKSLVSRGSQTCAPAMDGSTLEETSVAPKTGRSATKVPLQAIAIKMATSTWAMACAAAAPRLTLSSLVPRAMNQVAQAPQVMHGDM